LNYKPGKIVRLRNREAECSSASFGSLLDKLPVTVPADTKGVDFSRLIVIFGKSNHLVFVVDLSISEQKNSPLLIA